MMTIASWSDRGNRGCSWQIGVINSTRWPKRIDGRPTLFFFFFFLLSNCTDLPHSRAMEVIKAYSAVKFGFGGDIEEDIWNVAFGVNYKRVLLSTVYWLRRNYVGSCEI